MHAKVNSREERQRAREGVCGESSSGASCDAAAEAHAVAAGAHDAVAAEAHDDVAAEAHDDVADETGGVSSAILTRVYKLKLCARFSHF